MTSSKLINNKEMKKTATTSFKILGIILPFILYGFSFDNKINPATDTVKDADGNVYKTVTIGSQTWLVENLKTTHYRNGDPVLNETDKKSWSLLQTGAYSDYKNDVNTAETFGKLYNWHAVNDSRNICPVGWHVPSDREWLTLINFLGGESIAGAKLKEAGLSHWESPNLEATNASGFNAFPAGSRDNGTGVFLNLNYYTYFWSSTEIEKSAWGYNLSFYYAGIGRFKFDKTFGISVRCIKDK
jgi:uncharacterized protein (TIGR02145 family)